MNFPRVISGFPIRAVRPLPVLVYLIVLPFVVISKIVVDVISGSSKWVQRMTFARGTTWAGRLVTSKSIGNFIVSQAHEF